MLRLLFLFTKNKLENTWHVAKFDFGTPLAKVASQDFGGNVDRNIFEPVLTFFGLFLVCLLVII
jgi:hypothetical protein